MDSCSFATERTQRALAITNAATTADAIRAIFQIDVRGLAMKKV